MSGPVERYALLQTLFQEARGIAAEGRRAWIDRHCGSDSTLKAELEELLAADESEESGLFSEEEIAGNRRGLTELLPEVVEPEPWLPERVGRYRIERLLGLGGMGVVYVALQESPRRRVALKLLRPEEASSERMKRFRQEAELLGRLHHPGIAQILEAGTYDLGHGSQPFFAMELVDGVDIRTYASREQLTGRERLALLARVADAVDHAHERGVIHRDLKPENVLVDPRGQPKVLDFGIARAQERSDVLSTLVTREGVLLGTLSYMAPEQLEGKAVTARADIYALGVLAYELLTGRRPHEVGGLDLPAALRVLEREPTAALRVLAPELRGDVDTIVNRALAREPDRRYPSAAALASDIRRYLENLPIQARPPSRIYRLRKYARRNRAAMAIIGALLTAAVLSSFFGLRAAHEQRVAERHAYQSFMVSASLAIDEGIVSGERLDAQPERLRGWEWRHIRSRLTSAFTRLPQNAGDSVAMLALSPDEQTLLCASGEELHWVDLDTGDVRTAALPEGLVAEQAGYTATTGALLLAGGVGEPGGLRVARECWAGVWDSAHQRLGPYHRFQAKPSELHVSADRGVVLANTGDSFFLLDVGNGARIAERAAPGEGVATLSPDGSRVAFGGAAGELWILDGASLETLEHRPDTQDPMRRPYLSPDGAHVAYRQPDSTVVVLDLRERPARRVLEWPGVGRSGGMAFSGDGRLFASGHGDSVQRLWNLEDGELVRSFAQLGTMPTSCLFRAGSEELLFLTRDRSVRVVPTADPFEFSGHAGYVFGAAFAEPYGLLVTGGWDGFFGMPGSLRFWDVESGALVATLGDPSWYVRRLAVSGDGRRVHALRFSSRGGETCIMTVDLDAGASSTSLAGTGLAQGLTSNTVGDRLFWRESSAGGARIAMADPFDGRRLAEYRLAQPAVEGRGGGRALAVSPDETLTALTNNGELQLLRTGTFEPLSSGPLGGARLNTLHFDPSGTRLVSSSIDRTVRVWSVPNASELARLEGHVSEVLCAVFSPDGTRIASGDRSGLVRIWDAQTYAPVAELRGHTAYVFRLDWSADGESLASASGDSTVRLWTTQAATERSRAHQDRQRLARAVEPVVLGWLEELRDFQLVSERVQRKSGWSPREREVARQVLLAASLGEPE